MDTDNEIILCHARSAAYLRGLHVDSTRMVVGAHRKAIGILLPGSGVARRMGLLEEADGKHGAFGYELY